MGDDALGRALLDHLAGRDGVHVVERDDGFLDVMDAAVYFAHPFDWQRDLKQAMRWCRGRVLDVGCGAGRCTLHLESRGQDVVAIDTSPGAVEVCRRRGVADARLLDVADVDPSLGVFDTILLAGNNWGLMEDPQTARTLLGRFAEITSDGGRVVAQATDPYATDDPAHLAYHERNRSTGRAPGQLRLRIRYRDLATGWFDYLFSSRDEITGICEGTEWRVTFSGDGPAYIAVLEKP